jgi:hypothetical protein
VTAYALATGTLEALLDALRTNTRLRELTLYALEGFCDEGHAWVQELCFERTTGRWRK